MFLLFENVCQKSSLGEGGGGEGARCVHTHDQKNIWKKKFEIFLFFFIFYFLILDFFAHGVHAHVCMRICTCVYTLICRKLDLSRSISYRTIILGIIFEIQGIFFVLRPFWAVQIEKKNIFWYNFFIYWPILKIEIGKCSYHQHEHFKSSLTKIGL